MKPISAAPWALAAVLAASVCAAAGARPAAATDPQLEAAIASPQRSDADRQRDRYRHPLQTLSFFGIRPDMTVVEVSPGAGWYTEILAP